MKIKMKAICFLWLLFCFSKTICAQQGVLTTGGDITSTGGSVSFSIGQIAYAYDQGANGNINEGLQQPNFFSITGIEDLNTYISISLFPNPANQFVYLKLTATTQAESSSHFTARLFDVNGNQLLTQNLSEQINYIPLTSLTASMYMLQIWDANTFIKSFSFIKSN